MLLGYARCSTTDQDPALQLDALTVAGCERIWTETASGARRWVGMVSMARSPATGTTAATSTIRFTRPGRVGDRSPLPLVPDGHDQDLQLPTPRQGGNRGSGSMRMDRTVRGHDHPGRGPITASDDKGHRGRLNQPLRGAAQVHGLQQASAPRTHDEQVRVARSLQQGNTGIPLDDLGCDAVGESLGGRHAWRRCGRRATVRRKRRDDVDGPPRPGVSRDPTPRKIRVIRSVIPEHQPLAHGHHSLVPGYDAQRKTLRITAGKGEQNSSATRGCAGIGQERSRLHRSAYEDQLAAT